MGSASSKTASDKRTSFLPQKRPTLALRRPTLNLLRSGLPDSQFVSAQVSARQPICKRFGLCQAAKLQALRSLSDSQIASGQVSARQPIRHGRTEGHLLRSGLCQAAFTQPQAANPYPAVGVHINQNAPSTLSVNVHSGHHHSRRCNKYSGLLQYTHRTPVGHPQYTKCGSYIQQSNNRRSKSQLQITRSTTTTVVTLEFSVPSKKRCGLWQ